MDYLIIRYSELLEYNLKRVSIMHQYLQVTIHNWAISIQIQTKTVLSLFIQIYELRILLNQTTHMAKLLDDSKTDIHEAHVEILTSNRIE
jgi:hypothetical protein